VGYLGRSEISVPDAQRPAPLWDPETLVKRFLSGSVRENAAADFGSRLVEDGLHFSANAMDRKADFLIKKAIRKAGWR
jgi:hypothetical protein